METGERERFHTRSDFHTLCLPSFAFFFQRIALIGTFFHKAMQSSPLTIPFLVKQHGLGMPGIPFKTGQNPQGGGGGHCTKFYTAPPRDPNPYPFIYRFGYYPFIYL